MFLHFNWRTLPATFAFLSLVNLLFAIWRLKLDWAQALQSSREISTFSYRGHDYPRAIPSADSLQSVLLTVEESRHYPVAGYESDPQWEALGGKPWGYVRLKTDGNHTQFHDTNKLSGKRRMFVVTMFHELHCLRLLNLAFDESNAVGEGHITHCLNYLRQMALCDSDLTLESHNWEERYGGGGGDRQGATHVCRDWTQVVDFVEDNWNEWEHEKNM
ncbi:hypothetical protein E1B28_005085 [Marasmius oreades]|uniref:Uncharacterized protein n=1 Tax=Marasmius oreades TaxID=181124 RepID=A0A9P7UZV6_9AGAR|nr:uncharacterized protein E1B28_005085 [Marasmius oreades]KAG7097764.1 hypothetical protein E1B28_005085 [Marasmius oreades]